FGLKGSDFVLQCLYVGVRRTHLAGAGSIGAKAGAPWPNVPIPASKTAGCNASVAGTGRNPRRAESVVGRGSARPELSLDGVVFLCMLPTDMRKSFDSLAGLIEQQLGQDPLAGDLFVFRSRRGDRLKLLYWDSDGLAIWYKRLEEGTFLFPAADQGRVRVGE